MSVDVVEGWTARLDFQFQADGASVVLTTGDTVYPVLVDRWGTWTVSSSETITIVTASCGIVGFSAPSTSTFKDDVSQYTLRFLVVDGTAKILYFPNAAPVQITVHSA